MNVELLQELTEAHGVSGQEDAIREIVQRELEPLCEVRTDAMGNLICLKRGSRGKDAKKLMIAAHLDEIGYVVKYIDDAGFLRLQTIGGWDPRQMFSQRVKVHAQEGPIPGLLMYETKPAHMLSDDERGKAPKLETFFVDAGLSGDAAKGRVRVGDMVTMDRSFMRMGPLCTCKAMDDRVGVFVMIEAVKALEDHAVDVYAVATVQEEIGLRGAAASGWSVQPDLAVALDVTLANDIPGIGGVDQITQLGKGAAIKVMDSSLISDPKMVRQFRELAEARGIPHQMEILPRGGTDAGAIQRLHGGIPAITLSIPCRYVHTVNETVHEDDVRACIDLLARYVEEAD
jgi:tetrahedral aminopeptidase